MASMVLKQQLDGLLNSMYTEGLLDQQFQQLQMLQDASCPRFVAEVITLFCDDSERILTELSKLLDQDVADFGKMDAYVHQLKGSSSRDQAVADFGKMDTYVHQLKGSISSVGAQTVKLACVQFRQFCEKSNKDGCLKGLILIKHEFYNLRSKFGTMLQLEQKIQAYDAKQ